MRMGIVRLTSCQVPGMFDKFICDAVGLLTLLLVKTMFSLFVATVADSGMNVFVAFFVLLLLLADNTPPAASTIPLIGRSLMTFDN